MIREGAVAEEILGLIEDDEDIAILVLAAAQGAEPGPLVAGVAQTAGDYPIPVAIVPGHLSDEELDAMT